MGNAVAAGRIRPRIGFQITHIGDDYCKMYLPAMIDACRKADVDLTVFAGGSLYEPNSFDYQLNAIYNYLHSENVDVLILLTAALRSYVSGEIFDSFFAKIADMPIVSVSEPRVGCPSLAVDNSTGLAAAIRHLVEVHGRRRVAFICGPESNPEAQERFRIYRETLESCGVGIDPALVCPGDFKARSGIKAVTCLLDDRMASFDALVGANDNMVLGAMAALESRGISVPMDVSVVGFDNLEKTAFADPPLATVAQPFRAEARKAVELAKAVFEGTSGTDTFVLPTELVIRSSCGCFPHSLTIFDKTFGAIMDRARSRENMSFDCCLEELKKFERPETLGDSSLFDGARFLYDLFAAHGGPETSDRFLAALQSFASRPENDPDTLLFWEQAVSLISVAGVGGNPGDPGSLAAREKARIVFREARSVYLNRAHYRFIEEADKLERIMQLLLLTKELPDLFSVLGQIVTVLDIRNFFLVLHSPLKTKPETTMHGPAAGRKLLFAVINGRPIPDVPAPVEGDRLIPDGVMNRVEGVCLVASSIFCLDELFGYVCLEPGCYSMNLYNSLMLELGSVIKRCVMGSRQKQIEGKLREALKKLKESNRKLSEISQMDELTRLYNRRGFLELARKSLLFAQRMEKHAMLLFIDLDGLKRINDTWGHLAGDTAITGCAIVLKATFRQVDVIARLGGDEFVVLTLDSPYATKDLILERLRKNIATFNDSNTNAWDLSMSVGVLAITPDDRRPLEELIEVADGLQYQEKTAKRKARE